MNYPSGWTFEEALPDGTPVTIRPIRPDDAPALQSGFRRLSAESVFLRFLESMRELTDEQARNYATVDYRDQMAFIAEVDAGDGTKNLIASARYARVGEPEPDVAESAIVVGDNYQRQGLGTRMMEILVRYALQQGIKTFLATIHLSNNRILRFIEKNGFPYEKEMLEPGVWEVRIPLIPLDSKEAS